MTALSRKSKLEVTGNTAQSLRTHPCESGEERNDMFFLERTAYLDMSEKTKKQYNNSRVIICVFIEWEDCFQS